MSELQEVRVPDLGDYKEVGVIDILVKAGDRIEIGRELVTVETDKAAMDVPAPHAGVVKEVIVKLGDKVEKGSLLLLLEVDAELTEQSTSQMGLPAPSLTTPSIIGEPELVPEAPRADVIQRPEIAASASLYCSPSVRRLARELDVPLSQVPGTGPRGRITKDDVHLFVKAVMTGQVQTEAQKLKNPSTGAAFDLLPWPQIDFSQFGAIERRDLSRVRKISGANLHRNWVMIPHVTNHEEADITELEAFRVEINQEVNKTGIKVTLLALLIKAIVSALKRFPEFNASLDGEQLVLKQYYHVGFAADTPNGLVVPVIKDVDQKGIIAIAKELGDLSAKAREGKLSMSEMRGGCFSISSLGGIGGSYFTPIINAPEVAILGVGKSRLTPKYIGAQLMPRLLLPLSLSWDHRVIDGATAGRFNAYLAQTLADFRRITL